jgi:alkanesulfonate monooxygenase SsuD/methylene tetrahydromethanopterin reductase-like flavin-dependent oxidoreductase (luciferase family)
MFGLRMERPLVYMREYLTVLRQLLWDGDTEFHGEFFNVHASLPAGIDPPRTPLFLSALRSNAFRQAGEIADGAISWVCPIPYLVNTARPAMREGAEAAGRDVPPLIAHVPVVVGDDRQTAAAIGRRFLNRYARLPFYASMFAQAGYEVMSDGEVPKSLVDDVVVSGIASRIVDALKDILSGGIDELLVTVLPSPDQEQQERSLIQALSAAWPCCRFRCRCGNAHPLPWPLHCFALCITHKLSIPTRSGHSLMACHQAALYTGARFVVKAQAVGLDELWVIDSAER